MQLKSSFGISISLVLPLLLSSCNDGQAWQNMEIPAVHDSAFMPGIMSDSLYLPGDIEGAAPGFVYPMVPLSNTDHWGHLDDIKVE